MEIAAHDQERLPWEMIEEILSHVPPRSLVRFRTVCKRWNALFNDKTFINNHMSTFRFILITESKVYSVSIDPKVVVRELTLDVPGIESQITCLVDCNDFLLCATDKGAAVWNPWLKQSRWIKHNNSQPSFSIDGIGYDNNRRVNERLYKTIGSYLKVSNDTWWKIHDFASDAWKNLEFEPSQGNINATLLSRSGVSLNGNLYWITFYDETDHFYHLVNFKFSSELFSNVFCYLPCGMNHPRDALVLRVFREDRFSLFKQCHLTKKIEIWVTKNKINVENGVDVVWMNFMTVSIPNFPSLVPNEYWYSDYSQPSYFIDDKRLVLCFCDEDGRA